MADPVLPPLEAIREMFRLANITRVVYVDDIFHAGVDAEKIVAWAGDAYEKDPAKTQPLFPAVHFEAPPEVWPQELRVQWGRSNDDVKKRTVSDLAHVLEKVLDVDVQAATAIDDLFPDTMPPLKLSPDQWEQQKGKILGGVPADQKILCLFDHDLRNAPNCAGEGSRSGMGLIQDVVEQDKDERVICVLFTHTIVSVEDEMPAWRNLEDQMQLGLDRFLPLAKIRAAGDHGPEMFADGIKKAMLNRYCEGLKKSITAILLEACEEVQSSLMSIDPYDFDHMVLESSRDEGEWEANTLLRIAQIFEGDAVLARVRNRDEALHFDAMVKAARPISSIDIQGGSQADPQRVTRIRRQELYLDGASVIHSPLALGDLFDVEREGTLHQFVLLAQPCDLIIRASGQRRCFTVPLVQVCERISNNAWRKRDADFRRTHAILEYLDKGSNSVAVVQFADAFAIHADVLDLAVLDDGGICRFDVAAQMSPHPQLASGWESRVARLQSAFKDHAIRLDELRTHVQAVKDERIREQIWRSAMPRVALNDVWLPQETYSDGVFNFGLRRAGRLRLPAATRLLKDYTQYLSREAEELDFARQT